jgi:hypothetical protein
MLFHLITEIRRHRTPFHTDAAPVKHEFPIEAETTEEAVKAAAAKCRQLMRDNYADALELQNEDRSTHIDKAALMAEVHKEQ